MEDQNDIRPVGEAALHRIYDANSKREAQMEVERIFRENDRLDAEGGRLDQARAEGFGAGVLVATTVMMEEMMGLNALYPEVTAMEDELADLEGEGMGATMFEPLEPDDIDANEIIRELEGVDTNEAAMDRIERVNRTTLAECAALIEGGNDVEGELYVSTPTSVGPEDFDTPDGWEAVDDRHGVGFVRK
jgi:hypothetical protein